MIELRYSRMRLWMTAVVCMHLAAFAGILFFHPEYRLPGRLGLLVNGSVGQLFTLPLSAVLFSVLTIRCVLVGSGSTKALVTDAGGATVTTIWKSHRLLWPDLLGVRLSVVKVRKTKVYSLKFDRADGGTVSLPLNGLDIPESGYEYHGLVQRLSEAHMAAIKSPSTSAGSVVNDPAQPAFAATPGRPAFGRKAG